MGGYYNGECHGDGQFCSEMSNGSYSSPAGGGDSV